MSFAPYQNKSKKNKDLLNEITNQWLVIRVIENKKRKKLIEYFHCFQTLTENI